MEIGSLLELFLGSEIEKFLSSRKDLAVGDKLQGKIIEIKEDGKALIDFIKFRTIANVKFPVKVGEKISVTVVEKGENLKFSLGNTQSEMSVKSKEILNSIKNQNAGDLQKLVDNIKDYKLLTTQKPDVSDAGNYRKTDISKSEDGQQNVLIVKENSHDRTEGINLSEKTEELPKKIQNIIKILETQFKPFGPAEDILKIASGLKSQIENSGIFFEKKIASLLEKIDITAEIISGKVKTNQDAEVKSIIMKDLKPNLLILKDHFLNMKISEGKQKFVSVIRESIEELIDNIAKQQDGAVKRNLNMDHMQFFTFKIPVKDNKKAKLRVYYNKKNKKDSDSKGFNLSLLLVLDNLGEIRTDFFLLKKDLNVTFYVMDENIKKIITGKLSIVRETLAEVFRFLNMSVIVSKRKIRDFENEEISGVSAKVGLVDLSV